MIGKPAHFNVDKYLDCVEDMICSDEVETALKMLDQFPAYYKDHVPERAVEIRRSLNRQLFTPVQYRSWEGTLSCTPEQALASWSHRFQVLEREVQQFKCPHIMELAPGVPIVSPGLRAHGLLHTYEYMSLDGKGGDERPATSKAIFVCFETIEHLADPTEIYRNYLKFEREADVIMISTPLYTHQACSREWRTAALGHLRTYSPASLHQAVSAMFDGYSWSVELSDVIVLTGRR